MVRVYAFVVLLVAAATAQSFPEPAQGDFIIKDFAFQTGEKLPELRIHYRIWGKPQKDASGKTTNAVLVLHGTTGSGAQFVRAEFAGELFNQGQLLDAGKYFIIAPDNIGHGQSSKPSDGLRARFPKYGYRDMIEAQRRLLVEHLGVNYLRLVIGTSMGGMHSWLWGQMHPEFMDGLMPLASLPTQISGRNRMWRKMVIDSIRNDPEWKGGDYTAQPKQGLTAAAYFLIFMGSSPLKRQEAAPTLEAADKLLDAEVQRYLGSSDANDVLYAVQASWDYDPAPGLEKSKAPLIAVNFADDLINPPELGILEREIKRVKNGRAVVMPITPETRGHGTHTVAKVWKQYLEELLAR